VRKNYPDNLEKEVKLAMNSKIRMFIVIIAVVLLSGILVYVPMTCAMQSVEGCQETSTDCEEPEGWQFIWWLLNNSEPAKMEGKALTFYNEMLIVDTGDDQVRVALPDEWTVENDVLLREELFEAGFLTSGENITIEALRTNLIEKEEMSIYFLIGYKIINSTGIPAYAALPVNIETDL
jgi:hypothetical protein